MKEAILYFKYKFHKHSPWTRIQLLPCNSKVIRDTMIQRLRKLYYKMVEITKQEYDQIP